MSLQVYNSITKSKEEFHSIVPDHVGMYVCGPTVYGMPHVGHAKSYICFDVVRRYLEFLGYTVKYVQNITDIGHLVGDTDDGDDKIQKQALIEKLDPVEIAYRYECMYFDSMDKLNILRPSISCRATGHIIEIQEMIQKILTKECAYVTEYGNVYFDVRCFPGYGKLSGRALDNTISGERIVVASDKHYAEDFALWKKADITHIMRWPSPWGDGYPGWHIECSVMSKKYLGETFDIHGGGMDNIFPHHECECAQSETANVKPFVNYFLHNNLVTVNGTKMGKSMGNYTPLIDLFKSVSPIAVRFFVLLTHYRRPTDFVLDRIRDSERAYNRISNLIGTARDLAVGLEWPEIKTEPMCTILTDFLAAMDDDFNTSLAISYIYKAEKLLIEAVSDKCMDAVMDGVLFFDHYVGPILGLPFSINKPESKGCELTDNLIQIILDTRTDFKAEKNYSMADMIRSKLDAIGVMIQDTKEGTKYTIET